MEEELGKLTLTLTKRKTVKFSNFNLLGTLFAAFSTSLNFCQKPCTKDVYGAPEVHVQSWSARSPGSKLERLATLVMIFFV